MTSCIILAGGLSTRFPGGKLTYRLKTGKAMIQHVIEALWNSGSCDEVVVVASIHTIYDIRKTLNDASRVKLVRDEESLPCRGPIRGITSGALHARYRDVIVVPGDAGWLKPGVISSLKDYSAKFDAQITTPIWNDGFMPMLFMYISDTRSIDPLSQCLLRRHISRPSDLYRASNKLLLIGSKLLGDTGLELKTVNTPGDLENPKPRTPSSNVILLDGHSGYFTTATKSELLGMPGTALLNYTLEHSVYMEKGISHLAVHALQDACRMAYETNSLESIRSLKEKLTNAAKRKRHGRMTCTDI